MKTEKDYLDMQRQQYETDAAKWSLTNRDPVVGSYDQHNAWVDYDLYLFKDFDTKGKVALEYGCGPGRNLIRYHDRFARIDGVDISQTNLDKARINLAAHGISEYNLYLCDGKSIPTNDETYDVVFSVICLQHICCHSIRYNIMKEAYRVLKPNGYFCFQMGCGGREHVIEYLTAEYYDNTYHASLTNTGYDVTVRSPEQLYGDLQSIGFGVMQYDIRPCPPMDGHAHWIWAQVQK